MDAEEEIDPPKDCLQLSLEMTIDGKRMRLYTSARLELPWTNFVDLYEWLALPRRADIQTTLQAAFPHAFRVASDDTTTISECAAYEIVEAFATPERAQAWREAICKVLVEQCRAPTEAETLAKLYEAEQRSFRMVIEGEKLLIAGASKH